MTRSQQHTKLSNNDFLVGILPTGVIGYDLSGETGEFSGRIRNLKGMSVKALFFWLNIVEVIHDGGELKFSVGLASTNFPVDNFYESPLCNCRFDCNHLDTFLSSS
ncbi:hypothetical protein V6N13_068337 [Hibiscus sabdariffa]|uniref:Uncharacterized protein n=1 Tax=Hibiscus sabdariffa TaxID=183260 RepID=A0ABR2QMB1_9ROSI